jgi:glyoxylase-like metal-dependent hydrolase (beta-lactamase superfamily II)
MRRASFLACGAALALASWYADAQTPLDVIHVRGGVYMIAGPGGNTTVQIGADGVLLVDPQPAVAADALTAEIARLSNKPVRYIVNTNGDADHSGGNAIASEGKVLAGGNTRPATVYSSGGAAIWAHENVLMRLTEEGRPAATWPTDTYFVEQKDLFVNGEPVQLLHTPSAHTGGDSVVMFRRADVVSAGDTFTPDR